MLGVGRAATITDGEQLPAGPQYRGERNGGPPHRLGVNPELT